MKTIITYGTFDLFHIGHLRLLQRLRDLGDRLIVGVSTDEFNEIKGKKTVIPFNDRLEIVGALACVDNVFPEHDWKQKKDDIKKYDASIFAMGSDWEGKFDELKQYCTVIYLPRTENVSSTHLRKTLKILDQEHIGELNKALELISTIIKRFE